MFGFFRSKIKSDSEGRLSARFKEQLLLGNADALRGAAIVLKRIGADEFEVQVVDKQLRALVSSRAVALSVGNTLTVLNLNMMFKVTVQ